MRGRLRLSLFCYSFIFSLLLSYTSLFSNGSSSSSSSSSSALPSHRDEDSTLYIESVAGSNDLPVASVIDSAFTSSLSPPSPAPPPPLAPHESPQNEENPEIVQQSALPQPSHDTNLSKEQWDASVSEPMSLSAKDSVPESVKSPLDSQPKGNCSENEVKPESVTDRVPNDAELKGSSSSSTISSSKESVEVKACDNKEGPDRAECIKTGTGSATRPVMEQVKQPSIESEASPVSSPEGDMPSFDEWKKKMLDADGNEQSNANTHIQVSAGSGTGGNNKVNTGNGGTSASVAPGISPSTKAKKRSRNYASYECGAKVIAANGEAEGSSRILSEMMDEYMLNPCQAKIWFVVELCEAVQASSLELANMELFSSTPKDFNVYGSDRYPTRDWSLLGSFTASDSRSLQNFDIHSQTEFKKFIKIEMTSYYGSEHYCPLSIVRVYGTSMVEEFDAMESGSDRRLQEDAVHEEDMDRLDLGLVEEPVDKGRPTQNIFGSAREAVINIVRKAAMVLSKSSTDVSSTDDSNLLNLLYTQRTASVMLFKWETILKSFNCNLLSSSTPTNSTQSATACSYIRTLFGGQLYDVVIKELHYQPSNRFKCDPSESPVKQPPSSTDSSPDSRLDPLSPKRETPLSIKIPVTAEEKLVKSEKTQNEQASVSTVAPDVERAPEPERILKAESQETITPTPVNDDKSPGKGASEESVSPIEAEQGKVQIKAEPVAKEGSNGNSTEINPIDARDERNQSQSHQQASFAGQQQLTGNGFGSLGAIPAGSQSKESIFIRLNNKIRALEVNMSLSSQYLEELSLRYRRQMDEMQRAFNRTVAKLNETAKKAGERDIRQQEMIFELAIKLRDVNEKVSLLLIEKETFHWQLIQVHIILMIVEIMLIVIIASFCIKRMSHMLSKASHLDGPQPEPGSLPSLSSRVMTLTPGKRASGLFADDRETHSPAKSKRLESEGKYVIVEPVVPISVEAPSKTKKKKKKKHPSTPLSSAGAVPKDASLGLFPAKHMLSTPTTTGSQSDAMTSDRYAIPFYPPRFGNSSPVNGIGQTINNSITIKNNSTNQQQVQQLSVQRHLSNTSASSSTSGISSLSTQSSSHTASYSSSGQVLKERQNLSTHSVGNKTKPKVAISPSGSPLTQPKHHRSDSGLKYGQEMKTTSDQKHKQKQSNRNASVSSSSSTSSLTFTFKKFFKLEKK